MFFLRLFVISFLAFFGAVFLLSRYAEYKNFYQNAQKTHNGDYHIVKLCKTHSDLREYEQEMCKRRELSLQMSARDQSWREMWRNTHLCFGSPCAEIFSPLHVFVVTLALLVFLLIYAVLTRVAAPALRAQPSQNTHYTRAMEYGSRHEALGEGGPTVELIENETSHVRRRRPH